MNQFLQKQIRILDGLGFKQFVEEFLGLRFASSFQYFSKLLSNPTP